MASNSMHWVVDLMFRSRWGEFPRYGPAVLYRAATHVHGTSASSSISVPWVP